MKRILMALTLSLSVLPIAALAQQENAPPASTDQQQGPMRQTLERFAAQEEQLHQQMRLQILEALTPVHRRAIAATIGELAVAENPDAQSAAKRLDEMLNSRERQQIFAAHESFRAQSRQLHDQMRTELQSVMPNDHPPMGPGNGEMTHVRPDAGTILLMVLAPHPFMEMMGMHGMPTRMQGAPPPQIH
ncbi:MAG: hypothetical protein JOZ77_12275 [Candidatus Eremiobacteraeota bacterium]|nr:hypothetical protein [Candidatus Eremiobacteraeota bacterium]